MEMDSKKFFVYDTTNKFSEFIQEMYLWTYSVDICADLASIDDFNYSVYDVFFIIINEPKDFSLLFKTIPNNNCVLFLGTSLTELKEAFKENKRIRNLDILQNSSQMKAFIDSNIAMAC